MISAEVWAEVASACGLSVDKLEAQIARLDEARGALPPDLPPLYRDRDGDPLTLGQWAHLFELRSYRFVAQDVLPSGVWVATIWMGAVDPFDDGPLFETTVFSQQDCGDRVALADERYSTELDALAGHQWFVAEYSHPGRSKGKRRT